MSPFKWSRLFLVMLIATLTWSCREAHEELRAASRTLDLPPGKYAGIAWPSDNVIVVGNDPSSGAEFLPLELLRVDLEAGHAEALQVQGHDECRRSQYLAPSTTGRGKIGFVEECAGRLPGINRYYLSEYNLGDDTTRPLADEPLRFLPNPISWRPGTTEAVAADSNDLCANLVWLSPEGVSDTTIRFEDFRWPLQPQRAFAGSECEDHPRLDWPAWSPGGDRLAFFASPQSVGVNGTARLGASWNLYMLQPPNLRADPQVIDVDNARALSWSPNGDWLAFSGNVHGEEGVWLFAPEDQRLIHVRQQNAQALAWAPSGREIAAVDARDLQNRLSDRVVTIIQVHGLG
jgi:hypothetical protein